MQIQMIGHASIFVETENCQILMDPVLWDSHCEGIEDICPKRKVYHDQIPGFDILIISHRHLDHFDIQSLASLPKNVDVLIPQDKLMETCLRDLGYSQIYKLKDWSEVKIGSTRLIATRSENRVPEYGMLFTDPSGVFWNQVDSDVSLETIRKVKSRYPQIDFLLAGWQPMLETQHQDNQPCSFPYAAYDQELKKISLIKPHSIAPGANGFKFIKGTSWLNKVVFPVTREQFCRDVAIVCPDVGENVFPFNPGDVVTLKNGDVSYMKQKSSFVQMVEDDRYDLRFSPTNTGDCLIDDNSDNYDLEEMKQTIRSEICCNFPKFIKDKQDSLFLEYCHWNLIYQLEIVFPDETQQYYFDFSEKNIECHTGYNPLAHVFTSIAASNFYGMSKGIKGWDSAHMGGYYRNFQKLYLPTPYGIIKPIEVNQENSSQVKDPLDLRFPYEEIFEKVRQYEVQKWKSSEVNPEIIRETQTKMLRIGNTLVRFLEENKDKKVEENKDLQIASVR
ncbi:MULTISPECIES: MBL fold metallo-hydrolase [unclassified Moorena]|uniref:MBL fold metallo-hydrolase n=1 Tax=unclassified Moorena TaxID=2683338 RepID=UPI001400E11B|nr:MULTISPECIES: MBL fold metallo-hydrolase [unclassified Moorena]NEO11625.1 MBL fold metallo-hydrolase [Moorena sp. SIO3E8]NEP99756.1 MBL fold metallo-hydrolase [Moorena sp. SIO3F7]